MRRPRVAGPEPRSRRSRGGDRAADEGCRPPSLRGLRLRSPGCSCRRRAARRLGDRGRSTRSRRKPRRPCSGNVRRSRLFQLLFSNKNLPVGEGGMVVTQDDEVAARLRSFRSHGMTTLTWQRHRGHASSYDVVDAGLNYRLDEARAALALVQLRRLEDANAARRSPSARYREPRSRGRRLRRLRCRGPRAFVTSPGCGSPRGRG